MEILIAVLLGAFSIMVGIVAYIRITKDFNQNEEG